MCFPRIVARYRRIDQFERSQKLCLEIDERSGSVPHRNFVQCSKADCPNLPVMYHGWVVAKADLSLVEVVGWFEGAAYLLGGFGLLVRG